MALKTNSIWIALCCICNIACTSVNEYYDDIEVIDVENAQVRSFQIQHSENGIKAIVLETSNECLIGDVEKIACNDEYIFVFDKSTHRILQFDINGNFQRVICQQGRSPQEMVEIKNMVLEGNYLYVHGLVRKILKFDINGDEVQIITMPNGAILDFYPATEASFWGHLYSDNSGSRDFYLTLLDSTLTVKGQWQRKNPNSIDINYGERYFFKNGQNQLFYYHHTTDDVCRLDNANVTPLYRFDFGDKTPDYEKISKVASTVDIRKELLGKYCIEGVMFVGDFLVFAYQEIKPSGETSIMQYGAYDTQLNKTYLSEEGLSSLPFYIHKATKKGVVVYQVLYPANLDESAFDRLQIICRQQLSVENNPIILIDTITHFTVQ